MKIEGDLRVGALLCLAPIRCKNFNLRQTFNNWQVFLFKYNRFLSILELFSTISWKWIKGNYCDFSQRKEIWEFDLVFSSAHIVAFKICFDVTCWWHKSELSLKCANLCSLKFRGRAEERDMISQRCPAFIYLYSSPM